MKKLGIIQPGKIGDVIICAPIAKHYYDKGYEIIWPLYHKIIDNFVDYIDYVHFERINYNSSEAYNKCIQLGCNNILDISFCMPGAVNHYNNYLYETRKLTFDEIKYNIANLPIETKYNLQIKRNREHENKLYESLNIKKNEYCVIHSQGSDGYIPKINSSIHKGLKVINISNTTSSVFDWIKVLENSRIIITIDSCFANLCNQLKLKQKKYFIHRPPPNPPPSITEDWIIYNEH